MYICTHTHTHTNTHTHPSLSLVPYDSVVSAFVAAAFLPVVLLLTITLYLFSDSMRQRPVIGAVPVSRSYAMQK